MNVEPKSLGEAKMGSIYAFVWKEIGVAFGCFPNLPSYQAEA
jgi:hypothetical protein